MFDVYTVRATRTEEDPDSTSIRVSWAGRQLITQLEYINRGTISFGPGVTGNHVVAKHVSHVGESGRKLKIELSYGDITIPFDSDERFMVGPRLVCHNRTLIKPGIPVIYRPQMYMPYDQLCRDIKLPYLAGRFDFVDLRGRKPILSNILSKDSDKYELIELAPNITAVMRRDGLIGLRNIDTIIFGGGTPCMECLEEILRMAEKKVE